MAATTTGRTDISLGTDTISPPLSSFHPLLEIHPPTLASIHLRLHRPLTADIPPMYNQRQKF